MIQELAGKVAVVTGGTRGIGRSIAQAFVGAGINTAICARNRAGVDSAIAEMEALGGGRIVGHPCDVRQLGDVRRFFRQVGDLFGGIDILVNNAGVGIMKSIVDLEPEDWHRVIDTNLNGAYYCCRSAIPYMKTSGNGFIVNISSLAGKNPFAGGTAYNASKFGLNGFSEALMQDLRYDGIRVSYIMPGSVKTEFGGRTPSAEDDWKTHPEDVAAVVLHLLRHPSRSLPSRIEMRPSRPPRK